MGPGWAGHQGHSGKPLQIQNPNSKSLEFQESVCISCDSNEHFWVSVTWVILLEVCAFDKDFSDHGTQDTRQQLRDGVGDVMGKDGVLLELLK